MTSPSKMPRVSLTRPEKLRILWSGEASFLSTGFATFGLELLKRLHATDKYDILELASYGPVRDERAAELPWKYQGVLPDPQKPGDKEAYHASSANEFGEWKFEEACLGHLPHAVLDVRDFWMSEHQQRSPFRRFFHWVIQPTIDSIPQAPQWLSVYQDADAVFTYSDWGLGVLDEHSCGKINTIAAAPAGADLDTYYIHNDKRAHKQALGLDPDSLVVGTVMRNQVRKLYPALIEAFARFLAQAPEHLTERTYLYLHTAWPDVGWDIPEILREHQIGHRVYFTYFCKSCGAVFPAHFCDSRAPCVRCDNLTATLPNSQVGINRRALADIYNLFDVYVQYASNEGQGMPQVEAAACGLPIMATDYSAMSDVVRKLEGVPIRVLHYVRDQFTNCKRAVPDPEDFVSKLTNLLNLPDAVRRSLGRKARRAAERHYSWDATAKLYEDYLDSVDVSRKAQWGEPARLHTPNLNVPRGLTDEDFVRWGLTHVAGRPDLIGSLMAMRLTRDLTWGAMVGSVTSEYFNENSIPGQRLQMHEFTREHALNVMVNLCEKHNEWERRRVQCLK